MYNDLDFGARVGEFVNLVYSRGYFKNTSMIDSCVSKVGLIYRKNKTAQDVKDIFVKGLNKYGAKTVALLDFLTSYCGSYILKEKK